MHTLSVEKRSTKNLGFLRKSGKIPAVMYGRHSEAMPIEVDARAFGKVFGEAGESSVIELGGAGAGKQALIHEVSVDPVTGTPVHADFYVIEKGQKVTVAVPLSFVGVSPAVKDLGGILVKVMHELTIEVDPAQLPHELEVDITKLTTLDSQITVADLKLPASAIPELAPEEVIAMISVAQDEPEEPVAMDLSQIEVEKKGKTEEAEAEK